MMILVKYYQLDQKTTLAQYNLIGFILAVCGFSEVRTPTSHSVIFIATQENSLIARALQILPRNNVSGFTFRRFSSVHMY